MKKGFDNEKYLKLQTENILKRIAKFDNKLYLEFGGKLFDDLHASRVLPGFQPDAKVKILKKLKDKCEIIFVINANDIERNKIRADYSITYDMDVLRQIDCLREEGLKVSGIVITLFNDQPTAKTFANRLIRRNEKVYFHKFTKGYPNDINTIVSDEGYGANPYIETTSPLVIVTAPGPGSGKMATCLSQLYHEYKRGVKAGYAKFETFPVWNLDLKHPVNVAYEAATADLKDVNMIDNFHLNAYGKMAVNYNRDLEVFPIVRNILERITGDDGIYRSPTDMGVNMVGFAINDDDIVRKASIDEIIRRYYKAQCEYKKGTTTIDTISRIEYLMGEFNIDPMSRKVVGVAKEKQRETHSPVVALELPNGKIITGRQKGLMTSACACVLNAVKHLAKIDDSIELIPKQLLEPVLELKRDKLKVRRAQLSLKDVLMLLSISTSTNPVASVILGKLDKLKGCEAHSSSMLNSSDQSTLNALGVNLTMEPNYSSQLLYSPE